VSTYFAVCKPKVVALIVFTAVVGMLLAVPGAVPLDTVLYATIGIGLAAAAAAAINHVLDARLDATMVRTRHRPLPAGELSSRNVVIFALVLSVLSMAILGVLVNPLTAALTLASLVGYAIVYTVYLKHATPQNIVIGGIAGASPPVLGWAAVTDTVDPYALLLALIIFVWTPAHFWALAIYRRDDYAKAGVPMLPVTHGTEFTRLHIFFYTVLLVVVSVLPYLTGMSGAFYLGGALVLGAVFLYYAARLLKDRGARLPMRVFGYSNFYLMALFGFLLFDHYYALLV